MTNVMYEMGPVAFGSALRTLSGLLRKGSAHAAATGANGEAYVEARLAPDMFTLGQQVSQACTYVADAVARLSGRAVEEPTGEGLDSIAGLQALIDRTVASIEAVPASAFEDAQTRMVKRPLASGLELNATGLQYLRDWALPNFYFHVVTAYDILRHLGVPLGKIDYMAHVAYAVGPAQA